MFFTNFRHSFLGRIDKDKRASARHTPVGAATMPATLQLQPVRLNGTTQCSGGNLPPYTLYIWICNNQCKNVCHSDRSVSGVEESTTLVKEPPQGKTCYLRRFLGSASLHSEWHVEGWFRFVRTGCIRNVAWRWIIAATLRDSIQPHGLYSGRGGRQGCRPY